ncbi:MAG: indole-3-glycerol phosphate synthase TrpC [Planctomycetota bacterium]
MATPHPDHAGAAPDVPAVLAEIVANTRAEVDRLRRADPNPVPDPAQAPPRGFVRALTANAGPAVIAEIKRQSPSAGLIRPEYQDGFDPARIARAYHDAGASAISCLTDKKFFGGDPSFIGLVRDASPLPVLRKDFVVDPWQIAQTRALGADAVLLIAECLGDTELAHLVNLAIRAGLDILLESHDAEHLERCVPHARAHPDHLLLGINNRDLRTMTVDTDHTRRMLPSVPAVGRLVCESGIRTNADIQSFGDNGVRIFLIGEHLMRQDDPGSALRTLLSIG